MLSSGVFSPSAFYNELYTEDVKHACSHTNQLKAINFIHALLFLLPPEPFNYSIIINTDSLSSQQVLDSGYGKDPIMCACA